MCYTRTAATRFYKHCGKIRKIQPQGYWWSHSPFAYPLKRISDIFTSTICTRDVDKKKTTHNKNRINYLALISRNIFLLFVLFFFLGQTCAPLENISRKGNLISLIWSNEYVSKSISQLIKMREFIYCTISVHANTSRRKQPPPR